MIMYRRANWLKDLVFPTPKKLRACQECSHITYDEAPFPNIAVSMPCEDSFQVKLETQIAAKYPENATEVERCNQCGRRTIHNYTEPIQRVPVILPIQIAPAYKDDHGTMYRGSLDRLDPFLAFSSYPDPKSHPEKLKYTFYRLHGVILHTGGPRAGHYVSAVNYPGQGWLLFNDQDPDDLSLPLEMQYRSAPSRPITLKEVEEMQKNDWRVFVLVYERLFGLDAKVQAGTGGTNGDVDTDTDGYDAAGEDADTDEAHTNEEVATIGDATNGDATNGDATNGDATNGDATNGDATNGDATNGDATNGDATNGDATNGDATNGDAINEDVATYEDTPYFLTNEDFATIASLVADGPFATDKDSPTIEDTGLAWDDPAYWNTATTEEAPTNGAAETNGAATNRDTPANEEDAATFKALSDFLATDGETPNRGKKRTNSASSDPQLAKVSNTCFIFNMVIFLTCVYFIAKDDRE
jgi:hypothetical protein